LEVLLYLVYRQKQGSSIGARPFNFLVLKNGTVQFTYPECTVSTAHLPDQNLTFSHVSIIIFKHVFLEYSCSHDDYTHFLVNLFQSFSMCACFSWFSRYSVSQWKSMSCSALCSLNAACLSIA